MTMAEDDVSKTFTDASIKRIADAVRRSEQGNRDAQAYIGQPRMQGSGTKIFVGTYTGAWYAGQEKTVTFTNSTQTATVKNWCVPATNATSGTVIWSKASGTNSVLEISQAAGTASGGISINVGTFTGTWETGTFHMVTYKDSTKTELVKNWCVPVTGGTGGTVIFSVASGTQSVLEISQSVSTAAQGSCVMTIGSVSLTALTGYLAAEIQVLGHNTVPCLQWYSIATCATT